MAANRVAWLRTVARAALDGQLDAARLAAMAPADALADLRKLPGIGPMYATLILLRATGVADVLTSGEPRLPGYVAHFYGTGPGARIPRRDRARRRSLAPLPDVGGRPDPGGRRPPGPPAGRVTAVTSVLTAAVPAVTSFTRW